MLLVVTASVAYLALSEGRLCPHCGGATSPVVLRRLLRMLSPWVQWRWCSRCGWEGPGRRGPDLGPLDPPTDHDPGLRWADPDFENVPIFYWRSDGPGETNGDQPNQASGFKERADEEPTEATEKYEPEPPSFHFRPPRELKPPRFQWGPGVSRGKGPGSNRPYRAPYPWYLSWLVSKNPPGFQGKEQGGLE